MDPEVMFGPVLDIDKCLNKGVHSIVVKIKERRRLVWIPIRTALLNWLVWFLLHLNMMCQGEKHHFQGNDQSQQEVTASTSHVDHAHRSRGRPQAGNQTVHEPTQLQKQISFRRTKVVEFTILELEDPKLMHISRRTLKILRHRQWFRGEDGACDVDLGLGGMQYSTLCVRLQVCWETAKTRNRYDNLQFSQLWCLHDKPGHD